MEYGLPITPGPSTSCVCPVASVIFQCLETRTHDSFGDASSRMKNLTNKHKKWNDSKNTSNIETITDLSELNSKAKFDQKTSLCTTYANHELFFLLLFYCGGYRKISSHDMEKSGAHVIKMK